MTAQRKRLAALYEQQKYCQDEIQKLTVHPNGKTYGQCISDLIYKHIDPEYTDKRTYQMIPGVYQEYQKLHMELSSFIGNKSKVFTKDEYKAATDYMSAKWHCNISSEYRVN